MEKNFYVNKNVKLPANMLELYYTFPLQMDFDNNMLELGNVTAACRSRKKDCLRRDCSGGFTGSRLLVFLNNEKQGIITCHHHVIESPDIAEFCQFMVAYSYCLSN